MKERLGLVLSVVLLLTVGCDKKENHTTAASTASAASVGTNQGTQAAPAKAAAASSCPAGSTEATGMGFCIKLPDGFKFEKVDGDEISFVNATYDRIRIEHDKDYTFKNTPEDFKSMTANKAPTKSGVLLGGKGGWALLDDGKVATATVRINHPKGGMLTWGLSSDSKSGKVQSDLETVKAITLL